MGKLVDFFLNSHTKLPTKTINVLSKNQEFVKAITENKVPLSMKKKIFKQKGGILPMLLPFAAKAAAPLAGSLFVWYSRKIILEKNGFQKKAYSFLMTFGKKLKATIITFPQSRRRKNHHPLPSKNQSYKKNKSKNFQLYQNIL